MYQLESLFPDLPPSTRSRLYWGLGASGDLKCGITKRLVARRGGEMHFEELCSVPGGRSLEEEIHQKYNAERIGRTEWFRPSDRLLTDLLVLCVQQGRVKSVETLRAIMLRRLRKHGPDEGGRVAIAA